MAMLFTEIAISEMSQTVANRAIRSTEQLSWTQVVLLSLVGRTEPTSLPDIQIHTGIKSWDSSSIHEALHELTDMRLIQGSMYEQRFDVNVPYYTLRSQNLTAGGGGELLYKCLYLSIIGYEEIGLVLGALARTGPLIPADEGGA